MNVLRSHGHEIKDVKEERLFGTSDMGLLKLAKEKKRITSPDFDRDKYLSYREINIQIEQYAVSNPEHGKIIFPILNALRVQPKKE